MSNDKLFLSSGLFALSLYCGFIFTFFLYTKNSDIKKYDSISNEIVIQLEIAIEDTKEEKIQKVKVNNQKTDVEKLKDDVVKSISSQTTADVKSLFANVKAEVKKKETKDEVLNIEKSLVSSRFKSTIEQDRKKENVDVSNILENVQQNSKKLLISGASNNNYDEYYSKIYSILNQNWNPTYKLDGLGATVVITIFKDGKIDYKITQSSGNPIFDRNLDKFLSEEKTKIYPPHDRGKSINLEVKFISKE